MFVFINEGLKLLQTTAQELENCSFLFSSIVGFKLDTVLHRFDHANRYALCTTSTPSLWRSRSIIRTPPNPSATLAVLLQLHDRDFSSRLEKKNAFQTHSLSIHLWDNKPRREKAKKKTKKKHAGWFSRGVRSQPPNYALYAHATDTGQTILVVLMPDKRPGSWRGMWSGRDVASYAKSVFSTQLSVTFTFLFSQHSRLLSSKNRDLATQFSFLCMSSTVSGSNSWSFAIIGDHSLEVWQSALRMTGDTDAAKSSKIFPFFFFCLLPDISWESIFWKKDSAWKFPKKDEGTLQITVYDQSMTNATFETVGHVRPGRQCSPVWPPTKKKPLRQDPPLRLF